MEHDESLYYTKLAHLQKKGGTYFVTFRTQESVPSLLLQKTSDWYQQAKRELQRTSPPGQYEQAAIKLRKRYFKRQEEIFERIVPRTYDLSRSATATCIREQFHRHEGSLYRLICYCIMPNHVHLLVNLNVQFVGRHGEPLALEFAERNFKPLSKIMRQLKGASARSINLQLGTSGTVWQRDYYDYLVRDEKELENIWWYVLQNPVKAGLVKNWRDWPHTFWRGDVEERL